MIFRVDKIKGSDSMLSQKPGTFLNVYRNMRKLAQVSEYHPETYDHIQSYPAIVVERQKQLFEGGKNLIHPLSLASLIWKTVMVFVNLGHMLSSSLRIAFIINPPYITSIHDIDEILLALHALCFIDLIVNFNMGYKEEYSSNITMERRLIAGRYLQRWFLFDFVSCMPIAYIMMTQNVEDRRYIFIAHILPLFRAPRLYTVVEDIKVFMKLITKSYVWHGSVCYAVIFATTAHWCSCLVYIPPVYSYYCKQLFLFHYTLATSIGGYWYGLMPTNYNRFLGTFRRNLLDINIRIRYKKGLFITLSAFFDKLGLVKDRDDFHNRNNHKLVISCYMTQLTNISKTVRYPKRITNLMDSTGFSMFRASEPDEFIIHSLIILYSAMFMVYTLVFLLKVYMTIFNSTVRYQEMINQVEEYMSYKQFPAPLKKRVHTFYNYMYQGQYYREERALNSLSEELHNEITLHTCHKLVNKVALFEGVPAAVVGSVLGCLRPEVYLPNDLVVRAGDNGDSMYFIASGTVAVYSLKGVEVCHLEDGAYFGEAALLMRDGKRCATVVAVEITQVYRLDANDFRQFLVPHKILFERIQILASQRMHETVLLDEAFRREREKQQTEYENKELIRQTN